MTMTKDEALREINRLKAYVEDYTISNNEELYEDLVAMNIPEKDIHRVATNDYRIDKINKHSLISWSIITSHLRGKKYTIKIEVDGRLHILKADY